LEGAFDAEPAAVQQTLPALRPPLWRRVAVLAAVAAGTGVLAVAGTWLATRPSAPRVSRLTMTPSGPAALTINGTDTDLAVTPDGSRIVYVGNNGTQLFVRALDALEPVAIATGKIRGPFVSPDGQWVGFVENNTTLEKVAISGGPAITLATLDGNPRGATWLPDDTIVFATVSATGLQRVSAAGGTPTVVTRPDGTRGEVDHVWPEALPGGRAVLFTIIPQTGALSTASIAVLDLRTSTQTILARGGSHAHFLARGPGSPTRADRESGYLVYASIPQGPLLAVPFDLGRLAVVGPAVPIGPRVSSTGLGAGDFGVAADGTLVYVEAPGAAATVRTLMWVDRAGKEEPTAAPPRDYGSPRLSPDGTRLALSIDDQELDIWVWDLRRLTLTRVTADPAWDTLPEWTPDGGRIVFSSQRAGGTSNLWWQTADGTGTAERLTTSAHVQGPTGLTSDGTQVVFNELGIGMMRLALDGARRVIPLLQTPFSDREGVVSPDGRWLAYASNNSGRYEIYVRPFPNTVAGQWQVSTAGGTAPLWARSGKELFFLGPDGALMRVPVEATATTWNAGAPAKLLEPRYDIRGIGRSYDVSSDGQRFLMMKASGDSTAPQSVVVVQHFDEELKRLVPAGR
jgi:serine/threonine-protein kinase